MAAAAAVSRPATTDRSVRAAASAISVTERVGVIQRVRKMAVGVAQAWVDQQFAEVSETAEVAT